MRSSLNGNEGGWEGRNQRGRLKRLSEDLRQPYGRKKEGVELETEHAANGRTSR